MIISLLILVFMISPSYSLVLDPDIDGTTFNISEDNVFFYNINVTYDGSSVDEFEESFIEYSDNSDTIQPNFLVFNLNSSTGIINFTPNNDDVGLSSWITIIVENKSYPPDDLSPKIRFNVTNVNDPPNITSFYPASTDFSMSENDTQHFNYTASDDDSIHGDTLNTSWYLNGSLMSHNLTWNYTPGFCDSGYYNVTLIINDTSDERDSQSWNIMVSDNNRPPTFSSYIENRTWSEDTSLINNLTLEDFFSDPDVLECSNEANLTYMSYGNSSISIRINSSSTNVSFVPIANFFGEEYVYFTASDNYNTSRSNNITLNVTGINDAPLFFMLNQSLYENISFFYNLNATDYDNTFQPGTDTISYYTNSSIINISSSTGIINFTPSSEHLGYYRVNLSVDDGHVNTTHSIYFNISSNDPPIIDFIGNKNATENIFFVMNVTATDVDNDNLTFTSNFTSFLITQINTTAANFSFMPDDSDVGNYSVKITATDEKGASNYEIINFSVYNINEAPNMTLIANQTLRIDKLFTVLLSAQDPDGDNLTFYDNCSLFSIKYLNFSSSIINFTPIENDIGNYSINLSVSDGMFNDSQLVLFNVINNTPPILAGIGNFTFAEDSLFTLQINATDAEDNQLYFYKNTSLFDFITINSTSVMINFTPTQKNVSLYWINFSVNDSPLKDYEVVYFNITLVNDTPYFDPPLPNLNSTSGRSFYYDVNATDEENDTLFFSDNSTFFNISNSTGMINFTPLSDDIGNYTLNISVTDGNTINSSIIFFRVIAQNIAPNITSYYPNTTNNSVREGSSFFFNVTASDQDGDTITYSWKLNGTERSTEYYWTYWPGYSEAGFYNVTIIATAGNGSDSHSWNLTVNNTNRPPRYGMINHTSYSDFSSGSTYRTNITGESGNITISKYNGVNYYSSGNYTSAVIDLNSDTNLSLVNISWKEYRPSDTNISFQIRTSNDNSVFTNFSGDNVTTYLDPDGNIITAPSNQYLQYRAMLTTEDNTVTPVLQDIIISYKISDFEGVEDTNYMNYIDLDDFFSDPDSEDTLTYAVSNVNNIDISIDSSNRVSLTPNSDFYGTRYIFFTASDGEDNISSGNISLTFANVDEPVGVITVASSSSGGGGGGGGGTRTLTKSIIINQSKSFELIAPDDVRSGVNQEIIVPIKLKNNEDFLMKDIYLETESNTTGIVYSLSEDYIESLDPGDQKEVELKIKTPEKHGSFSIKVSGKVSDPALTDSATISITSLHNTSQEIQYVRDFISLNPECFELNELVILARQEIENYNYDKAQALLDNAVDSCKYLLSAKTVHVSEPAEFPFYTRILQNPYSKIILGVIIIGVMFTVGFSVYNRFKWY